MHHSATVVHELLRAVGARDLDAVLRCFSPGATWQNVPHPAAVGHDGIRAMLGPILARSSRVQWDVTTEAYSDDRAWVERVDRFWIDGSEYAVRCNAVIEFDSHAGLITEFRDYVDVGEWRARLGDVEF